MPKYVILVDPVKSFPTSILNYLLAKIGFDTAENEPLEVWGYGVGGIEPPTPMGQPAQEIPLTAQMKRRSRQETKVDNSPSKFSPTLRREASFTLETTYYGLWTQLNGVAASCTASLSCGYPL